MLRKIYHSLKRSLKKFFSFFKKQVPVYIPVYQNQLLKNRVALITGGTSGIGYEIAKAFLNSGAKVIITSRNQNNIDEACKKLEEDTKSKAFGMVLNNTDIDSLNNIIQDVIKKTSCEFIDILVNNAGVLSKNSFGKVSKDEFDKVLNTNLRGSFFLSQEFANYMKENKIKGNILNIASSSSLRPAVSPYTLSKWGIKGMTLGLAKALIPYGIVVNGIAPGPTATSMLLSDTTSIDNQTNPTGRYATATEIANMAVILTSGMGKMIVGDIVYMTGGAGLITLDDVTYSF